MMDTGHNMTAPKPRRLLIGGLLLLLLNLQAGAADSLVISEFMANNNGTLADENGDYSDWIEISNTGTNPVNLLNWGLTDDASKLAKWRFPSTNLTAGKFLVVFASNKNRRTPGAPLHTNFKLDAGGEFLALVQPDGTTIASQFIPAFPPQDPDISYGFAATGTNIMLVPTGAVVRAWVPRNSALGTNWTLPAFDDSGWISGTTGVGYDRLSGYESLLGLNLLSSNIAPALRIDSNGDGLSDNNSVYIRVPFVLTDPSPINSLTLRMRHDDGFVAYLNGQRVADDNAPAAPDWNSSATTDYGDVTDVMMAIVYGPGNNITIYRNGQVYASAANASYGTLQTYPANVADFLIGKRHSDLADGGTPTGLDGFLAGSVTEARVYGAALSAADILNLSSLGPLNSTNPPPSSASTNLLHLWSFNDGTARDSIGPADGTLFNGASIVDGRLQLDGVDDYMRTAATSTNISARTLVVWMSLDNLSQQGGSALTIENPSGDDVFDGIIYGERIPNQWINGSSFWQRTAADNGGASETVIETSSAGFVAFDLSAYADKLIAGTNILAIHGLNFSANDSDMLILPEIRGGVFTLQTNQVGYFDHPTPGAMNSTVFQRLFASLDFSHTHGFYSTPFSLSVTSDAPGVTIRYTLDGSPPSDTNGSVYTSPIPVNHSTVVRAAAFQTGLAPTETATRTYLFLADVLSQTNSAPAGASWDTEMDSNVVNSTTQTWSVAQGLVDLPVLSIVMDNADLFGASGIYANPTARGDDWERAASTEFFYPAEYTGPRASDGFAINCGIQINGNYSRLSHQPKHSFRLVFKEKWGPTQLSFPVFEDYEVQDFDTLIVTCGHNQGWSTGVANSQFLRNRFAWDLEGARLGNAHVHNRSVHVYLNGLYWGVYDLCERPDEAFSASNFSGDKDEYDAFKGQSTSGTTQAMLINGVRDSWDQLFTIVDRDLTQATNYAALQQLVDLDQLIDFNIGILYTADRDGPTGWINGPPNSLEPKNFYATRRRAPDGRFRFWRWDSEFTLESESEDVSERQGYENPARIHYNLRANADYRLRFADRVQQLFFNGGPYSTSVLTNHYLTLAAQIDKAVVAESARWGDSKREPPYTRDVEWVAERNRIVGTFFPNRRELFLSQLRADNLFPSFSAPTLNLNGAAQNGGQFSAGSLLSFTATNGQIYFTLDGTDPRLAGGGIATNAIRYTNAFALTDSVVVSARVYTNGQWSALSIATVYVPADWSKLLLTEIMYNPPASGDVAGDDFAFLELKNTGSTTLALDGLEFTAGISFTFPSYTLLAPGHFFVLAANAAQFQTKYPGVTVGGVFTGQLNHGGETLRLAHPTLGTILEVTYGDAAPWPTTPDNLGFSLVPRDPNANPDPSDSLNWRASALAGGSPGSDDPTSLIPPIKINEVLSASLAPQTDAIELFNPTTNAVDLSGWFLTDDNSVPRKFRIPDDTFIGAGGFVVFTETNFNATPGASNCFALSSSGEKVYLYSADRLGNLTGYDHGFAFGAAEVSVSFGRYVLSTGHEDFPAQISFSPGATNSGPRLGPVVITEIMYHPAPGENEFIEIKNISTNSVPLFDTVRPTNTWKLNGLGFTFPAGLSLAPGEWLLIVATDPTAFRARYNVPADVRVLGPYAGSLQNSGERLELQRPGVPDADGLPFITVDAVRFNDKVPWPVVADGSGPSLQRLGDSLYGNDPIHWTAALATPGTVYPGGTPPSITTQPADMYTFLNQNASFTVAATGTPPLFYQWRFNGSAISTATNTSLTITNAQATNAGTYSVVVFNSAGAVGSSNALLTLRATALITQQPTNRTVIAGNPTTFSVTAAGQGTLRYQWRFYGTNLPNVTTASFTLTNVQPTHEGPYVVIVTDDLGSETSQTAYLTVYSKPVLLSQPQSLTVLEGGTATFTITVSGTPPMTYRWRRNGVTQQTFVTNALTSTYTITNAQMTSAATYSVGVSNPYGSAPVSSNAVLTVLADHDRDGMADVWEVAFGFSTNNAADALLDRDGDGMLNWEEYVAGTNPTNAQSYLKLEAISSCGQAAITFQAVSNRNYLITYTDGLEPSSWNTLTNVPARSTNWNVSIPDLGATTNRFYRVIIPAGP